MTAKNQQQFAFSVKRCALPASVVQKKGTIKTQANEQDYSKSKVTNAGVL